MDQTREDKQTRKEMVKELREARKQSIEALVRRVKEQKKIVKSIMEQLREGPKTVPETASALGLRPSEVMWYFAALKKYGRIAEGEKDGGYFRYEKAGNGALDDEEG